MFITLLTALLCGAGSRQSGNFSGPRSGPPMLMPATPQPQPQLHNALGNLLDDEDDYVIIDGPSPFNSTHGSLYATHTPRCKL